MSNFRIFTICNTILCAFLSMNYSTQRFQVSYLQKKNSLPSVQFFDYSLALTIFLGRFCLVSYCQFPSRTRHRVYQGLLFSVPKLCLYTMLQKNWFTLLTERISMKYIVKFGEHSRGCVTNNSYASLQLSNAR